MLLRGELPAWGLMWVLAFAIYFGCKWATLFRARACVSTTLGRSIAYLLAWPGMDARAFLSSARAGRRPATHEWIEAAVKTALALGALTILAVKPPALHPLLLGWLGMIATAMLLHFGLFHLLSLAWRSAGIDAAPLMDRLLAARSLADFWSRRWNTGFHALAGELLFRPTAVRWGARAAVMLTFLASGVVHDAVISLPAGAGFGGPTLYFALQGLGVLVERTPPLRRRPFVRRMMALTIVLLPAPLLLFHPPFVTRVFVPFLHALGSI
jgi:hypothetical protein